MKKYFTLLILLALISTKGWGQFNSNNLAILVAAASANNTTVSVVEIDKTTANQSAIYTISIPSTGTNAIRVSGSATSTLYAANSADGTLFAFTGHNSTNTSSNANTLNPRAVVTVNNSGTIAIATTYTGTSGNQTRGATTLNNTDWFIGDQGGFYTNSSSAASPSGNIRSVKVFGSNVYAFTSSASLPPVGIISAPSGGTYTALPGLANGATSRQDFYLISSGSNGSEFDVLYILDATGATTGTIFKYSLVSGSWVANGSYATSVGGFGICAEKSGSGANIYFTTGTGATAGNTVRKIVDDAGYNATINVTSAPVTLFTAATGTIIKGIAFAPKSPAPSITVTSTSLSGFAYTVGSGPSAEQSFTVSGSSLTADITITPPTNYEISTGTGLSFSATNPITLSPTNGTVDQTVIYVRLKAGLSAGAYNSETINITSTGADPKTVTCSGDVWPQIEWANLQWPASGTIAQGDNFTVYAQVYKSGVTDAAGQGAGIQAWIGYSTSNTNPNTWTNWVEATYNTDDGNNDEYMANIGAEITASGTYYYASRFKYDNADYVYGGTGGFWNGTGSNSGELTVTPAPTLEWVNLQWPASGTITTGGEFFVYAQAYKAGLTPGPGAGSGISAWIGYSTDDTDPSTWTNWHAASYFGESGNNDEYRLDLGAVITSPGTYYYASRFKLGIADYQYGGYSSGGGGFWNGTTNVSGVLTVQTPEPSNHAGGFTATQTPPTTTTITLNWTDASPAAEAYLIKGSNVGFGSITAPVDGTAESDGTLVKNVLAGVQTHTFTGLSPSTTYYFKIWPYNGTGANINYKTDGSVPEASAETQAPTINTYTWIGANNASWTTASNWNPSRTDPQNSDQLLFNDGSTKTITGVATGNIGRLTVTNNTKITLQAGTTGQTLSIGNNSGHDLVVDAGSELNVSGSNTLSISVVAGATGSISGSITLSGAAHRLLGNDANSITFNTGSLFVSGTSFSGNPFGQTNLNSIVFSAGSVFEILAGGNPFGATAPSSVVVFQSGSLFRHKSSGAPAFSGRTYADFEYDNSGTASPSGTGAVSIENLTIKQGTFNINLTGTPGNSIKGNINVHSGATLTFSPANPGTIQFNGPLQQTISGSGTITSNGNSTLMIDNASGVILDNNMTLTGHLQIGVGSVLTLNAGKNLTVSGNLTNSAGTSGLVIKSNTSGTGSLIHNTNNVPATIERYITGSTNLSSQHYHTVSIPLNSGVTAAQFLGSYLYEFNTSTQQWQSMGTSLTTPLPNTQGYLIFYPNNSTTYNFVGQLNNGSITFSPALTAADQFALLPNPYPSAINTGDEDFLPSNFQGATWIWNPQGPNYASYSNGVGVNGGTAYIPAGQAFFMKSTAANPSLYISNYVRVHNSQPFFKSTGDPANVLRVKSSALDRQDEIALRMYPGSSAGYDGYDVDKLFGANFIPQTYFDVEGKSVAINNIPDDALPLSVPMGFTMQAQGTVGLSFEGIESFDESVQFILEDLLTGTMINLRETPVYTFAHSSTNSPLRFVMHLTSITSLPGDAAPSAARFWTLQGDICLSLPDAQQPVTIEVFDALGRTLAVYRRDAAPILRIPAPAAGVMLLRATTGNKVYSSKVFTR